MFDNIAPNYDFHHTLSLGMDNYWRRKAIKKIKNNQKVFLILQLELVILLSLQLKIY